VELTKAETARLDTYEGGYRKEAIPVVVEGVRCTAVAYVAGSCISQGQAFTRAMDPSTPPSEQYLTAIHCMLREHSWKNKDDWGPILIQSCQPGGEVVVLSEWMHPGIANLSLAALVVEVNFRGNCGWKMPVTIGEVLKKLATIGCMDVSSLLTVGGANLERLNCTLASAGKKQFGNSAMSALRELLC
jgi:hypothetical protein